MAKSATTEPLAETADPFAGIQPVAVDRLSEPKQVEINPAAAAFVGQSFDNAAVLEVEASDAAHAKALVKHLRAAANSEGVALRVKIIDEVVVRFKASPRKERAQAEASE
ncbi:MAG: hypothetical protein NVS3B1_20450 [Marmoricola sp.]